MTDQELYQYIDDYLSGRLTNPDKDAFEKKLETDTAFKKEFELHRDLQRQMQKNGTVQELKQILTEVTNEDKSKTSKSYLLYGLLGLILLITLIYFLFFTTNDHKKTDVSPKDAYLALYEVYPPHPILRSELDSSYFKQAMLSYAEGDYARTIQILKTQDTVRNNDLIFFYQALSQMELKEYEAAEDLLKKLAQRDLFDLEEPVLWYQSLLLIRKDQLDSAKLIYNRLPASSIYREKGEGYFQNLVN